MIELRQGEILLENCAGGKCAVCKQRILPGKAVQLSKNTNSIRHIECVPQTDSRNMPQRRKPPRKILPE